MSDTLPTDLVPLPTAPYPERPLALPLNVDECRTAIWMVRGNITEAAKLLKVTALRLRTFVQKSPFLSAEMQEAKDQLVDIAEGIVYDALTDGEDKSRQDSMARFVLGAQGKARGWGSAQGNVNIKNSGGVMIVQWADGTNIGSSNPPGASDNDPGGARSSRPDFIDITPERVA